MDYTIENVKEDIIIPHGAVYVIQAKYTQYYFDYINDYHYAPPETKHVLFIIPRDTGLLNQILEKSKKNNNTWKVDFKGDGFDQVSIYFVDGSSYSKLVTYAHKSINYKPIFTHFRTLENFLIRKTEDFDDFLRKVFNSIILNEMSKECVNDYYLYTFNKNTRVFSVKSKYFAVLGELFPELVSLEYVYKGIQSLITEEQLNRLKSEINKENRWKDDCISVFTVLRAYCENSSQIGISHIYKDLYKSLALASLKEAGIPYNAETDNTNQPRYW